MRACDPEGWRATTAIAVARDPWARALSGFRHLKAVATTSTHSSDVYFGSWLSTFTSFAHFVESGGLEVAARVCAHFVPMLDYVMDPFSGTVLVDRVFKFEELHADRSLQTLMRAAGLTEAALLKNVTPQYARPVPPPDAANKHCAHYTRRAAPARAAPPARAPSEARTIPHRETRRRGSQLEVPPKPHYRHDGSSQASVVAKVYAEDARALGYQLTCAEFLPPLSDVRPVGFTFRGDARIVVARRKAADFIQRARENKRRPKVVRRGNETRWAKRAEVAVEVI